MLERVMASKIVWSPTSSCVRVTHGRRVEFFNRWSNARALVAEVGKASQCQRKLTSSSANWERSVPLRRRKLICAAINSLDLDIQTCETTEALQKMRQQVELAGGDSQGADDMQLLQFLQAKSMDTKKAATAFVDHQKWRSQFVPNGHFTEADLPTELDAKKSYWIRKDKQGRPALLTLGRNHVYNKNDFDEFKRFIVYALDKVISGAPPGTQNFLAIVDLKGLGMKNLDSKSFLASFELLKNHYPRLVDKIFMVNVPVIFNGLWKVVSPFLDEGTKGRIIFVDKTKLTETLLAEFDIEDLPKEYGGNAELVLLQDVVIPK